MAEILFKSPEYIESKGRSWDQVFHNIENHITGVEHCYAFKSELETLFAALKAGEIKLTESQKEIIKEVILYCFDCE